MKVIIYNGFDSEAPENNRAMIFNFASIREADEFAKNLDLFLHQFDDRHAGMITYVIARVGFDRTAVYGSTYYTIEGDTIDHYPLLFPRRKYRIVEAAPAGWEMWNIGRNTPDGFTLFAKFGADRHMTSSEILAVKN